MAKNLFREKNLKRISSPDELDKYIQASSPRIWLVISAIIILLVSFCIWGIWGRLETVVTVVGTVENGEIETALTAPNSDKIKSGMNVSLDRQTVGVVENISSNGENSFHIKISTMNLPDGKYELDITVESINPIYFILN